MGRRNLKDRHILITGASGGIGRARALKLAPYQTHLLLVSRREPELVELARELETLGVASANILAGDITVATVRDQAIHWIQNNWGCLDMLVNNAGISAHGRFAESNEETLRRILEVNFFAAVELTSQAIPSLRESSDSAVVNVCSILGHRGIPYNNEYCASKFALRGWSEAIRPELSKVGVDVLLVSPGTIETDFFDHLITKADTTPWGKQRGIPPEKVADQIIRALQRRKTEIYPNWRGRLLVLLNRFFPRLVDRIMRRYG